MCGIAGWIDPGRELSSERHIVESMSERLSARGPDDSGCWVSPHAVLGHKRLVVVDPAGGGQPMIRKKAGNTYVIVYNGELYNTEDLRRELTACGHGFTSTSDTEVLLTAYMEWGPGCVEHLNGIFAFAVWDEKRQAAFLARDRFGVKPLFYMELDSGLLFASELKAILAHPRVKREVAKEGLAEVFALGPSRTPGHGVFKGVYEVKPAYCMTFDSCGLKQRRYWSLESRPHTDSIGTTVSTVRELVVDAIKRQLVADVPVCTFLSGGLDSTAITAIAAQVFRENGMDTLRTYSVDYMDNALYFKASSFQPNSDAEWVGRVSDRLGTNHRNVVLDTGDLADALVNATAARDLPGMADIDSSLWLFCREIKKNATVALSGECADEIFGGYPWFHREDLFNADTFPWAKSVDERLAVLSGEFIDWLRPKEYIRTRYEETLDEVPRLPGESPLEMRRREIAYLNISWFMATLLDRKDRMSMAHGLEVRVPYCDHRLVEYVWNVPWEMKAAGGVEKGLLRRALAGIVPDEVLNRRKSPYPKTHNPAYETAVKNRVLEILGDSSSPLLPMLDRKAVRNLAQSDSDYGKPWFGQLMAGPQLLAYLIQADTWMREYHVGITE